MLHLIDLSPVTTPALSTQYAVNLGDDLALLEVTARDASDAVRVAAHLTGRLDAYPPGPVRFEVFEAPRWVPECVYDGDPCDAQGVGCDGSCVLVLGACTARRVVELHVSRAVGGGVVLAELGGVS